VDYSRFLMRLLNKLQPDVKITIGAMERLNATFAKAAMRMGSFALLHVNSPFEQDFDRAELNIVEDSDYGSDSDYEANVAPAANWFGTPGALGAKQFLAAIFRLFPAEEVADAASFAQGALGAALEAWSEGSSSWMRTGVLCADSRDRAAFLEQLKQISDGHMFPVRHSAAGHLFFVAAMEHLARAALHSALGKMRDSGNKLQVQHMPKIELFDSEERDWKTEIALFFYREEHGDHGGYGEDCNGECKCAAAGCSALHPKSPNGLLFVDDYDEVFAPYGKDEHGWRVCFEDSSTPRGFCPRHAALGLQHYASHTW